MIIGQHNVSSSPGQLVILDSDEPTKERDLEIEDDPSVCEVTPLLPSLSLTGTRDATIQRPTENSVAPAVAATTSPRFSSFLLRPEDLSSRAETSEMVTTEIPMDITETSDPPKPAATREDSVENSSPTTQNLVITRQEVFALTSVLGRLPQSMICQPGPSGSSNITSNIVDGPQQSPTRNLTQLPRDQGASQELGNKRQKSEAQIFCKDSYVTQASCLEFLRDWANGSIHFKTDAHLIEDHRIRLETPGLPLFDRTERELIGNALKEATRVAKEIHSWMCVDS